jgi:hypothetical protein
LAIHEQKFALMKMNRDEDVIKMKRIEVFLVILVGSLLSLPVSASPELTPENTVILSNETDQSFCKDFSVLLDRLRPEWVILDSAEIPELVQDKNLIIIGELDAEYTGVIITELLTQEEITHIREGHYAILEKESPWAENRTAYICTGSDRVLAKKAAEEALNTIMEITNLEEWTYPPYSSAPYEEAQEYITWLQHIPEDDELPLEALRMEVDPKTPRHISAQEASEDVEYLFYLFSHGYCGYGYFNEDRNFDAARNDILKVLDTELTWSPKDLSLLIYNNLAFIHDCHLSIGTHKYGDHQNFWYDTDLELWKDAGTYWFISDNDTYKVISVDGKDPEAFMVPSLNAEGDPIYRIGMVSSTSPEPLTMIACHEEEHKFIIQLHHSEFEYFSEDIFQEDTVGGIPVIRIRSFSDHHSAYINQFLEAAEKYKEAPCLIIDIRGNGGGNEKWPKEWITEFTNRQPSINRYFTELISKTTMMGRYNYLARLLNFYPEERFYQTEMDKYYVEAELFEREATVSHWTGPFSSASQIPNETTVVVVMNGKVGSAGEGFLIYLSQVENVVFVGENSLGALVFGQMSSHRLPHSTLLVQLPISLNIALDLEFREEKGLFPDLWIPAEDALNYAVAAVRKGTITTVKPLSEDTLQKEFVPEKRSMWGEIREPFIFAALIISFGTAFAFLNRKRNKVFFFAAGACWVAVGVVIGALVSLLGPLYFILAILCIIIGVYKWREEQPVSEKVE